MLPAPSRSDLVRTARIVRLGAILASLFLIVAGGAFARQSGLADLGDSLSGLRQGLEHSQTGAEARLPIQQEEDGEFESLRSELVAALDTARDSYAGIAALEAASVADEDLLRRLRTLAAERIAETGPLELLKHELGELETTRDQVEAVLRASLVARRRVAAAEPGENLGRDLLSDRAFAGEDVVLEDKEEALERRLSRAELQLLEFEARIANERHIPSTATPELFERVQAEAGRLRGERREYVRMLQVHLALHREYRSAAEQLRDFIDQQILWAQSVGGEIAPNFSAVPQALDWLVNSSEWQSADLVAETYVARHRTEALLLCMLVLVLVLGRRTARRALHDSAAAARRLDAGSIGPTVVALLASLWIVSLGPVLLAIGSRLLTAETADTSVLHDAGVGLRASATVYATLSLLRGLALRGGLGEAHFRWSPKSTKRVRRELRWSIPFLIVSVGLSTLLFADQARELEWKEDASRLIFMLECLGLSVLSYRLLGQQGGAARDFMSRNDDGLLARTRRLWYSLALLGPLALGVLAYRGFYYSAIRISGLLQSTILLILGLILAYGLATRWLWVTRRSLRVEQARQRAEAREDGGEEVEPLEDEPDLGALDAQTRQLFTSSVNVAAVVGLWLIWSNMIPALGGLGRIQLWPKLAIAEVASPFAADLESTPVAPYQDYGSAPSEGSAGAAAGNGSPVADLIPGGATRSSLQAAPEAHAESEGSGELLAGVGVVTLADVAWAALLAVLTWIAVRNIPALIEIVLLQRLPMDAGSRLAVTTLVRYLIAIVGTSVTFGAIGISWSTVQWLAAALTFGLAFGLQEIFANFVSGLIILIERPIRLGDVVTVSDIEGRVTRLRMRATTITDLDRRELLVPNKEFITNSLINWTLSDPVSRIVLKVGIAYGSDTRLARKLLLQEARACALVLNDPEPRVVFRAFGESSLDFELRAHILHRENWSETFDALNTRIDDAFRQAGIEISFPQRDLHVRSSPGLDAFRAHDAGDAAGAPPPALSDPKPGSGKRPRGA